MGVGFSDPLLWGGRAPLCTYLHDPHYPHASTLLCLVPGYGCFLGRFSLNSENGLGLLCIDFGREPE